MHLYLYIFSVCSQELDTRIIIGSFSQELAPKIFCEVFKLKMFGADYAWILHESMRTTWWQNADDNNSFSSSSSFSSFSSTSSSSQSSSSSTASSSSTSWKRRENWRKETNKGKSTLCSPMELYEAVENLIIVSSHNSIVGNNISFSGLVSIIDFIFAIQKMGYISFRFAYVIYQ